MTRSRLALGVEGSCFLAVGRSGQSSLLSKGPRVSPSAVMLMATKGVSIQARAKANSHCSVAVAPGVPIKERSK